jgi:hypothetical protein
MKNIFISLLVLTCTLLGCQPKAPEPAPIGRVWKAHTVKQNGGLVYTEGGTSNTKPSYAQFRLDLTSRDQVTFVDIDGRKTVGTWSLSPDNNRLILENLSPPPSESTGNIEFYVTSPATESKLELKRTTESRKTGNSVNEYVLVPE